MAPASEPAGPLHKFCLAGAVSGGLNRATRPPSCQVTVRPAALPPVYDRRSDSSDGMLGGQQPLEAASRLGRPSNLVDEFLVADLLAGCFTAAIPARTLYAYRGALYYGLWMTPLVQCSMVVGGLSTFSRYRLRNDDDAVRPRRIGTMDS